ncbi:1-phosphofructokinase family hexose kinase [Oceanobacillus jeddahense]|uniref:Tagatose-6-phosphate kinase n=1 Tax=Oceanobacillus jeddahense TaxID=1462527 RepID=A0ABY5JV20_9BACI|nr:PfkB family carbohydrate kinase [Oceanobacillus jeddahense]UUI03008.1 PfkB family carbohydrate kinase [Oceanobacillus jeddahense]
MIYTITPNPAIDIIVYLEGDLTHEKNNITREKYVDLGGKPTHVSAILEQLGDTANKATGFSGELNKAELVAIFDRYQMNHEFIDIAEQRTRESIIVVNNSGGSYMITERGLKVSDNDKEKMYAYVKENIRPDDIAVVGKPAQGFSVGDFRYLIRLLKEQKAYVACDVASEYLNVAIEENIDFVKPNKHEINDLFPGDEPVHQKLNRICDKVPNAVCSLGSEGALYKVENTFYQVIPPKVEVKSDTGAGDAFVTGYIYGVANGYDVSDRVKWGVLCSASKVQHYSSCQINKDNFEFIENNLKIYEVR